MLRRSDRKSRGGLFCTLWEVVLGPRGGEEQVTPKGNDAVLLYFWLISSKESDSPSVISQGWGLGPSQRRDGKGRFT